MVVQEVVLSPQEQRIEEGQDEGLTTEEARARRARLNRLLKDFRDKTPKLSIQRAHLFTESFKETEDLPLVMRWARALQNTTSKIDIAIGDEELIVGACDPARRHALIYPELRGVQLLKPEEFTDERRKPLSLTAEDIKILNEDILPYWQGKTLHERYAALLPEDTRRLVYAEDDIYTWKTIWETITVRSSLQWALDNDKVLRRGFNDIKREAEERLTTLDPSDPKNNFDKMPFLKAVIIVCDAAITFAKRYAELARSMAKKETSGQRKRELTEIAEICEWVPANPARTFHEAVQSQWFAQVISRLEQNTGTVIGNGRTDQYLYPYYKKDIEEGRITRDKALELLECLWLKMAQFVLIWQSRSINFREGYTHWEQTCIGGQTRDGQDATNELSHLILESKKEFPLAYPDLAARIHARTPEPFLWAVCELIKEGTGFPKLLNDEEIIPLLLAKGATLEEARDYTGSGCTEVRMLNRDTYMTPIAYCNLGAIIEMTLNNGALGLSGGQAGLKTGDPRHFNSFDDVMNAFRRQAENLVRHLFIQQSVGEMARAQTFAAPLLSCLHDLCMQQCTDIHQGKIEGGLQLGAFDIIGYANAVDSLTAIKKLVYDDKKITMGELLEALKTDFEGKEEIRQMLLNAPKYGNNDNYVDSLAHEVEDIFISFTHRYRTCHGAELDVRYVPTTIHVYMGNEIGATPDGRKAREPLSDGVSPSQGSDTNGPTAALLSIEKGISRQYKERAARLLNMKLSPQAVAGEEGTKRLASLIRTWCDLKLWHIQFNIINTETLKEAQKHPEKYRNLLVRVAGYSAFFVDLPLGLQNDIIRRSEHQ
jgi:pyruvate formate-lyase/glycerol dehydratase family glycyl radical enzyme